ncbi:MAG: DUF5606 domain-containing protein [Chitinophagaceae bacterium]|nr:DUF5606 domain-containing protein [Chitinophagaceae bacterium]
MEYGKLIAVTGMPGLYELVSSKTDGAIVRSLDDNSTKFASTRQHQFSHLESIEVYTVRDNVNLTDILKAMETVGGKLPDEKDAKAIKAYFEKVYPDLDFERVYTSDMKKMVKWFSIIKAKDIEIKLTEQPEEEVSEVEEKAEPVKKKVKAEPVAEEKPVKKAAQPKAAKKEEPKTEKKAAEEAPKKKAAPKKKKED